MNDGTALTHHFVEFIPDELVDKTVYVSIPFATASHKCFCGCGNKVVTPLQPTDWKLVFDGKTVSLDPSIGNWSFPCRSHYWITKNQVRWADGWSDKEIRAGRRQDQASKSAYFGEPETKVLDDARATLGHAKSENLLQRFRKWLE